MVKQILYERSNIFSIPVSYYPKRAPQKSVKVREQSAKMMWQRFLSLNSVDSGKWCKIFYFVCQLANGPENKRQSEKEEERVRRNCKGHFQAEPSFVSLNRPKANVFPNESFQIINYVMLKRFY